MNLDILLCFNSILRQLQHLENRSLGRLDGLRVHQQLGLLVPQRLVYVLQVVHLHGPANALAVAGEESLARVLLLHLVQNPAFSDDDELRGRGGGDVFQHRCCGADEVGAL